MFTKGPWHISGDKTWDSATGEMNIHIGAANSAMVLASMNPIHTHTLDNAHLIAASPDLYRVCKHIEEDGKMFNALDKWTAAFLQEALAKAEGKS